MLGFNRAQWMLVATTVVLRVWPILEWWRRSCVRDECTYRDLASSLMRGDGMVGTRGWLWAPGYPGLLAAHGTLFGKLETVKYSQVAAAAVTVVLLYRLTRAHFGDRAAIAAGLLFAVNPTHIFYASSLWSESFYTALLLGMMAAVGWARGQAAGAESTLGTPDTGSWPRALLVGALLGSCVLFRGVATYLLPCVILGLLWERHRSGVAWKSVAAAILGAVLVVAPYSAYATQKFGAFVVSDRTLGQMMWLGNNTYPPISFDYGNGLIDEAEFDRVTAAGRRHCPHVDRPAVQDACELDNGVEWIKGHPGEFIARVPLRVSQMLTPHSLLTRNLRTGRWKGLPAWVDEALVASVPLFSFATLVGGTIGLCARARGWYGITAVAIVGYHVAAIACLAGLSRYRVPLEPLWMVFASPVLVDPKGVLAALRASRTRFWCAVVLTSVLTLLMLRFLPAAWPSWGTW